MTQTGASGKHLRRLLVEIMQASLSIALLAALGLILRLVLRLSLLLPCR